MGLDVNRLKEKIKLAFEAEQTEEEDYNAALDRICGKIAVACIEEIKEARIEYQSGLVAPNGAVTGIITHTIS